MQRIVYYFPEIDSSMSRWQRMHFIEELSHYGFKVDTFNPLLYPKIEDCYEDLMAFVKKEPAVMFMTCLCNNRHLSISVLEEIKKLGLPTLSFRPDNLTIPFNDKEMCTHFDLLWLTSKETKYLYDSWGAYSYFAPYAANPFTYQRMDVPNIAKATFLGTVYGARAKMVNSLSLNKDILIDVYDKKGFTNGPRFKAAPLPTAPFWNVLTDKMKYGIGRKYLWAYLLNKFIYKQTAIRKADNIIHKDVVPNEKLAMVYSSYRLSLASTSSVNTDVLKNPVKILNLRSFEIPMCGGIQFCKWNDELADYFEEGNELVMYHDDNEMMDKANYYLFKASDSEISRMRIAARNRAEQNHTWLKRFEPAFKVFGIKY